MHHMPYHEPEPGGLAALALTERRRLEDLLTTARNDYGGLALRLGDRWSRAWLHRSGNPYLAEIEAISKVIDGPGAYLLNLSFEWTCTSAAAPDPAAETPRLVRSLDWEYEHLGRSVMVVRQHGPAGDFFNVTWPGFVGVLTAMAPGRFAVAINQPPMTRRSGLKPLDWILNRLSWRGSKAMPPSHLLRQVCETCATYDQALEALRDTELCIPVFYTLVGAEAGQGCVIERTQTEAGVRDFPAVVANDWLVFDREDHQRGWDSPGRYRQMLADLETLPGDFSWVKPPVLNAATRLTVMANPGSGSLQVQGWEGEAPATQLFTL
ncbi:hypothetical protein [Magnetospira sp. QH-2]|uniref:hypothetical protein n=1 Tax=Magnetospira sp. (strain QH-2) TaxID=1288970 RepID=UPI0003E81787|nr:hypothetical protein [Magnetospira sp. QH-2]CCQ72913.1 protein of unknown function [Magnetospira sp. QH-2]